MRLAGLRPAVWHEIAPNPKDHEVEAGFQRYAESGCDVIIGLGGGSCIDAAKGVAILSSNGGRILDLAQCGHRTGRIDPRDRGVRITGAQPAYG